MTTAYWIKHDRLFDPVTYECSACGNTERSEYRTCPPLRRSDDRQEDGARLDRRSRLHGHHHRRFSRKRVIS